MGAASLFEISTETLKKAVLSRLSCRIREVLDLKLALNSLASEQLALGRIGWIIDDLDDQFLNRLRKETDANKHLNDLYLRVRRELNIIYDQISNGLDACGAYPPHRDGECECYEGLFKDIVDGVEKSG